jgi:hypothetical protein
MGRYLNSKLSTVYVDGWLAVACPYEQLSSVRTPRQTAAAQDPDEYRARPKNAWAFFRPAASPIASLLEVDAGYGSGFYDRR